MNVRPIRIEGDVAYVPVSQGYEAVIDAADVPLVDAWSWSASVRKRPDGSVRAVYAVRMEPTVNGQRMVLMHRAITDALDGMEVDHIDGDGLNNRRCNMRLATKSQNQHNGRTPIHNTSGIKGVSWQKKDAKWRSYIRVAGKQIHLGQFETLSDAAAAYAEASAKYHGEFGRIS